MRMSARLILQDVATMEFVITIVKWIMPGGEEGVKVVKQGIYSRYMAN